MSYAAPIVITQGGTYTGNYQSLSSGVPCVRIATSAPVVLDGCLLVGAGNLIQADAGSVANLTVRNCTGQGLTPTTSNQAPGRFLDASQAQNLVIEHNAFTQTSGIVVNHWTNASSTSLTLKVRYNRVRNIDGRWTNGGNTLCSFLQLNTVTHLAGIEIAYNEVINTADQSRVEDNINLYNSSGTAQSPLHVHDNFVRGAYPYPATSSSFTGTGMTTDGDGSTLADAAGYIEADHNQFVGTGNAAMNLAAGHDVYYHDNRAVTSGTLPDGRRFNAGWAGLGVFNYYNQPASVYFNNRVENNTVGYVRWGGNSPYQDRQDLSSGACAPCTGTISLPNPITTATEDAEQALWQQKVQQAGVTLGPLGGTATIPTTPTPTAGAIVNPGFELNGAAVGLPTGWATQTGAGTSDNADYTEAYGGGHTGTYHATHYRPDAYEVYTYQTVTNLPNGTYQLNAWFKSTGGQPVAQLKAQGFGGSAALTAAIPTSPNAWVQVSVPNIVVTNGQCQIGVYSQAGAGQWLHFDDFELVAQAVTVANIPPTVALTAATSLILGQALALSATAADADGTVSKVEFYNGTTLLGTATSAPYQLSWTPTAAGTYSLTAKATDNSGATTTSAAVAVTVTTPPVATSSTVVNPGFEADNAEVGSPKGWLTSGSDPSADYTEAYGGAHSGSFHGSHWRTYAYQVYTYQTLSGLANGTYKFSAWIKSDGGQPVAQLRAQNYGGALLTAAITNTYGGWVQVSIAGIAVTNGQCEIGFYSQAQASQWFYFDDVTFAVQAANVAPTVALAANSSLTLGQALALSATAADADGTVSKVEFYNGTTLLGTATSAPYQLSWTPTAAGTYSLTAKATDNTGATTTSAAVAVTVTTPPVATSSTVVNPGFEADNAEVGSPKGWLTSGSDPSADYTEAYGGAHSGSFHGSHWRTYAYQVYTYQTLSGLANGTYKFSAWIKSDGGQPVAQLRAQNYGGALLTAAITNTYGTWVLVELANIAVTNGQCEIGFYSQAQASQWFYFDDVTFAVQTTPVAVGTVLNASFDDDPAPVQSPRKWLTQTWGSTQAYASYTEAYPGAHSGTYHGTHYRPEAYEVYTYQTVTNLPNGVYKLNAWVKSSGGQPQVQLRAQNSGGVLRSATIAAAPSTWVQVSIAGIVVSNGQCEVGLYSQATGGQWLYFDDVELVAQGNSAKTTLTATTNAALPQLYPNPANDQVAITKSFDHPAATTLILTDLQGNPVARYKQQATAGDNQFILNTSNLPGGIYLLHIEGDKSSVQRLEVKH